MKIEISHYDLQKIYELAKADLLDRHNIAVDSHLYPLQCMIAAFMVIAQKQGLTATVSFPCAPIYEPVDDYD